MFKAASALQSLPIRNGVLLCIAAMSTAACNRPISRDEAKLAIEQSALIRSTDNVSVDAIASTNPGEPIVRATISGQTMNLKFRRFDKGWTWEFVETKAGGWVAPDIAIKQIREENRSVAAAAWAEKQKSAYTTTAAAMNVLMIYVPTPRMGFNVITWMNERRRFASLFKNDSRPDMRQRAAIIGNEQAADAWGSEFLVNFDSTTNQALLVSIGPDKMKNTEDDVVCLSKSRQVVEDGELRWTHDKSWKLPEGLGSVVEPFTDKPFGTIEYTRVEEP